MDASIDMQKPTSLTITAFESQINAKMTDIISHCYEALKSLMEPHDASGHGLAHCLRVYKNAKKALEFTRCSEVTPDQYLAVLLAALLHDADDRKLFTSQGNENASFILGGANLFTDLYVPFLVLKMIDLVSCSTNGNSVSVSVPTWMYIPRDSDRLEAIGEIGILRAYQYTVSVGRPLATPETQRARTEEELARIATTERFQQYLRVKESVSLIDHFYDKIMHIDEMATDNMWLVAQASIRRQAAVDFLLEFGKTGKMMVNVNA